MAFKDTRDGRVFGWSYLVFARMADLPGC